MKKLIITIILTVFVAVFLVIWGIIYGFLPPNTSLVTAEPYQKPMLSWGFKSGVFSVLLTSIFFWLALKIFGKNRKGKH